MRKHIKTVNKAILNKTLKTLAAAAECPASCQSACKLPALLAIRFVSKNNSGCGFI